MVERAGVEGSLGNSQAGSPRASGKAGCSHSPVAGTAVAAVVDDTTGRAGGSHDTRPVGRETAETTCAMADRLLLDPKSMNSSD